MARARVARSKKVPLKLKGKRVATKKHIVPLKPPVPGSKQAARKLDRVSRKYDVAVEKLRGNLEVVSECLYDLLATEAKRERRRRFATLAEAGVLHDLQTLAAALDAIPPDNLPPALSGVERYAHLAVLQLTRTFAVEPIHQPGDEVTVRESQQRAFDWSADAPGERTFPLQASVLRCGWKCGSDVLVKPKIIRVDEQLSSFTPTSPAAPV